MDGLFLRVSVVEEAPEHVVKGIVEGATSTCCRRIHVILGSGRNHLHLIAGHGALL